MDDERSSGGCGGERPERIFFKRQRVSPTVPFDDIDGKVSSKDFLLVRVMVADRCNSGEKVFESTPPKPHRLRYGEMLPQRRTRRLIDVVCPRFTAGVNAISQPRK